MMWIYLRKYAKICCKTLLQKGQRWAHVCLENLFKSTVESSRSSSRKQKTGYCLPSSLNRSSLILRLILSTQTQIHPISDAVAVNKPGHATVKHRHQRWQRERTQATEVKRPNSTVGKRNSYNVTIPDYGGWNGSIFALVQKLSSQSSLILWRACVMREGSMRLAPAAGLHVKKTTFFSKRGDRWANGCGVLASLSAEGGFCPARPVMSPPLCAGNMDGSTFQIHVCIFILCGPALKQRYDERGSPSDLISRTRTYDRLQ